MAVPWNLCRPEKQLLGYDLSPWQGKAESIDWDASARLGIGWVISKAWSGGRRVETTDGHLRAARDRGLLTGRYAWWYPLLSDASQVDAWTSDAELKLLDADDFALTIDIEEKNVPEGEKGRRLLDRLFGLTSTVFARTGRKAILYTGDWYWREWLGDIADIRFVEHPNWHAAYPHILASGIEYERAVREVCDGPAPRLAAPWRLVEQGPFAWQFDGDRGLVLPKGDGVSGVDVDVNIADLDIVASMVAAKAMERVQVLIDAAASVVSP